MKDISHHMRNFIKNYSKGENPKDDQILEEFEREHPLRQQKKQNKVKMRNERLERTPIVKTAEQRDKELKTRIPKVRDKGRRNRI